MDIVSEAKKLISGDRRKAYGPVEESFQRVANMWTAIAGQPISREQVALMMVAFKLSREANSHKDDNIIDAVAYLLLYEQLTNLQKTRIRPVWNLST